LVICNKTPWFFQMRDGPFLPTLRTLHKYPAMMPRLQVDVGAIPFVLRGVDLMCRGFTSKGGKCEVDLPKSAPVAIYAEGRTHACAVGVTRLSTHDIRTINRDVGVDNIHFLGDGLWQLLTVD